MVFPRNRLVKGESGGTPRDQSTRPELRYHTQACGFSVKHVVTAIMLLSHVDVHQVLHQMVSVHLSTNGTAEAEAAEAADGATKSTIRDKFNIYI